MSTLLKRLDNGTIEFELTIPWLLVKSGYEKAVLKAISETEISGFRKGKAPREMVEQKLDQNQLYSQAVQELLPSIYSSAVKANQLKPVIQPHITLVKGEMEKDWQFLASVCESPTVVLSQDYKSQISQLPKEPKDSKMNRILECLIKSFPVNIPDLLVEEEANHRLVALIENITQLGLTTTGYLQAKKLTPETLKADLATQSKLDLQVEFLLNQIKIEEKLADRQKTVDFLLSLL